MLTLPELTVYISHTCDLACEGCFTFNQLNWGKHFDINNNVEQLKDKVDFEEIFLLGGEPLLNPYLKQWMDWMQYMWPHSRKKWIVTNGRNLDKLPPDWHENWQLEISAHSPTDLEQILDWLNVRNFELTKFYDNRHTDATVHYKIMFEGQEAGELSESWKFFENPSILENNKPITWKNLNDANKQHSLCPSKECLHLLDGRFYRCPQQAILPQLHKKFRIEEPYSSIASQDVGCKPSEFLEWIETRNSPQEQCRLCDWSKKINLPEVSDIKKIKVTQLL
tara:strand:- start:1069 stop:1908 length:840 start_codon:yes stop_codon:yes gene_type:complete